MTLAPENFANEHVNLRIPFSFTEWCKENVMDTATPAARQGSMEKLLLSVMNSQGCGDGFLVSSVHWSWVSSGAG